MWGKRTGSLFAWAGLDAALTMVSSAFVFFFIAHRIGDAAVGVVAMAFGMVQVALMAQSALFHDAIIQRQNLTETHLATAWTAALLIAVLLSGSMSLFAPTLAGLLGEPRMAEVLPWLSLVLILEAPTQTMIARLRRDMAFKSVATRTGLSRLGGGIVGTIMAATDHGAWSLVAQYLVGSSLSAFIVWRAVGRLPRPRICWAALVDLVRFGRSMVMHQLVVQGAERAVLLMVGAVYGAGMAGQWAIGTRLIQIFMDMLTTMCFQVSLSLFARQQHDRAALRQGALQASRVAAVALTPAFCLLAFFAPDLITGFLGPSWSFAGVVAQAMSVAALVRVVRAFPDAALSASGNAHQLLAMQVANELFGLALVVAFLWISLPAAAVSWAASTLITLPISVIYMRRLFGSDHGQYVANMAYAAGMALSTLLCLEIVSHLLAGRVAPLLAQVATGAGAMLMQGALILALQPALAKRLWALRKGSAQT